MANDIGPTRPKYIVTIIIIFPILSKKDVKFLDKPTVAVALAVSYKISTIDLSIVKLNNIVEIIKIINDIVVTATAFLVISLDKFLLNNTTTYLFLTDAIAIATSETAVMVFIPPAVPTGEPPINIKIKHTITD